MSKSAFSPRPIVVAATMALVTACGGGGGSGSGDAVSGLTVPKQVSVISSSSTGSRNFNQPSALRNLSHAFAGLYSDAGTDYSNASQDTWIHDDSMQAINLINEILCMVSQTAADQMVNQGSYIALIDGAACRNGANGSSSASSGQSSGGRSTQYDKWVVNATRASNADPQIVQLWIPEEDETIRVEATINEEPSAGSPYGSFTIQFQFVDNDTNTALGGGTFKTVDTLPGFVGFSFFEEGGTQQGSYADGEEYDRMAASVVTDADGTSGVALTSFLFEGRDFGFDYSEKGTFGLAFNSGYVLRQSVDSGTIADLPYKSGDQVTGSVCMDRGDLTTNVWRYDLFDAATGAALALNSGFPFTYDNGGSDVYGHVGYWGMWLEDPNLNVPDGATITKQSFGNDGGDSYTVVKAPGKLIKSTAAMVALSKITGVKFNWWGENPDTNQFGEWVVEYLDGAFKITQQQDGWDQQTGQPILTDVNPDVDISTAMANGDVLGLWSEGMGGRVNWSKGQSSVTVYVEEFVNGSDPLFANSDTPVTLHCMERCLQGDISDFSTWNAPYEAGAPGQSGDINTAIDYTISRTDMTLLRSATAVKPAAGVTTSDMEAGGYGWGINSGEMVTGDVLAGMSNWWDVYDPGTVTVSYRWETGLQPWNHYTAVKDSLGGFVSFSRPIQFMYEHSQANDRNDQAYNGEPIRLNYGGSGDLWGIPWEDADNDGRWYAKFAIKDGVEMGPTGTEYVIKAREMEQKMTEEGSLTACTSGPEALVLNDPAVPLPTAASGTPGNGSTATPAVTAAPAVIAGQVQPGVL